jgi:hypothetical protein
VIYTSLNPEKALIWRIIHRDNLEWVLDNGIHCGTSLVRSPQWVSIGNAELIDKRANHAVPHPPGGVLNDYVPFYFTPFSIMLANIKSGRNGIVQRPNSEIVILVSSLPRMAELGLPFLFTDKHAYFYWTKFYDDLADLSQIDWGLLQRRDFRRDPEDPEKLARYQAEALVHKHAPIEALVGVVCSTDSVREQIAGKIRARGLNLPVHTRPGWYF